jgi:hypothetical protein
LEIATQCALVYRCSPQLGTVNGLLKTKTPTLKWPSLSRKIGLSAVNCENPSEMKSPAAFYATTQDKQHALKLLFARFGRNAALIAQIKNEKKPRPPS